MILHIDHIAIASCDFERDINILKSFGYKVRFIENRLKNSEIKREFVRKFTNEHDIALLDRTDNFSIELVNYGYEGQSFSSFYFQENSLFPLINLSDSEKINLDTSSARFNNFFLNVNDLDKAIFFWKTIGFCLREKTTDFAILIFKSLLCSCLYTVQLIKKDILKNKFIFLDDIGFNSLAIVSSNLNADREKFKNIGLNVTDVDCLNINGKKICVFFVSGFDGEILEVIGVNKL